MDRKPKARRVASKEPVKDDPEQSKRFVEAAQGVGVEEGEEGFIRALAVVLRPRKKTPPH